MKVKGKQLPVVIYELMTDKTGILPEFEQGLNLYRGREFEQAEKVFALLAKNYLDEPSRLYQERCREYLAAPPPAAWDGVYTAKTK